MISYSHEDRDFVELVETDLEDYNHDVAPPWRDEPSIEGGADWAEAIGAAIDDAYAVIVVCSANSARSDWVMKEIDLAVRSKRPLIPVQLEAGSVPLVLRKFQIVDFSGVTHSKGLNQVKHYRLAFDKLVQAVDSAQPVVLYTRQLSSPDLRVRAQAARSLGEAGDLGAVDPLIGALRDDDGDVRYEAARSLGQLHAESAVRSLVLALGDDDADVCAAAAWALGELEAGEAINPLIEMMEHDDRIVRETVALSVGRILADREGEGSAVVRPLIKVLRTDVFSAVRDAARTALSNVGGEEADKALEREKAFTPRESNETVTEDGGTLS
jgi:hypothetical protein